MYTQSQSPTLSAKIRAWLAQFIVDPFGGLTAAELTRLSWARKVENFAALPEVYQPFMDGLLARRGDFPHAVLTPTFRGFLKQENERLVFSLNEKLYILEKSGEQITPVVYPLEQVNYVELGVILLHAWLKVSGLDADGAWRASTLRFNSVTDMYFDPFIQQVRQLAGAALDVDRKQEKARFDCLERVSFKFMNYGRRSLLDGERVEGFVFQPEISYPRLSFGRWTTWRKMLFPAHLSIFTDRELILVRDDPASDAYRSHARYGGIWDFIPRRNITAIDLREQENDALSVSIHLPHNDRLDLLFDGPRCEQISALVRQLV